MKKSTLVKKVAKKLGLQEVVVEATIDEFCEQFKEALKERENIFLPFMGSFKFIKAKEKIARNPQTNERFYLGQDLKLKYFPPVELREEFRRKRITEKEYLKIKAESNEQ